MALCPVCKSRKGKRPCRIESAGVCSQCCGTIRNETACGHCGFYKPPKRNYTHLPRYSPSEMKDSDHLLDISFSIEAAICSLDEELGSKLTDAEAIEIIELLLDIHAFEDTKEKLSDKIDRLGCLKVVLRVEMALKSIATDVIVKVLGTIRHVAQRRAQGGRHYLDLIRYFTDSAKQVGDRPIELSGGSDRYIE